MFFCNSKKKKKAQTDHARYSLSSIAGRDDGPRVYKCNHYTHRVTRHHHRRRWEKIRLAGMINTYGAKVAEKSQPRHDR